MNQRVLPIIVIIATSATWLFAQAPATRPSMGFVRADPRATSYTLQQRSQARLTFTKGLPIPDRDKMNQALRSLSWQLSPERPYRGYVLPNGPLLPDSEQSARISMGMNINTTPDLLFESLYREALMAAPPTTAPTTRGRRGGGGGPADNAVRSRFNELITPSVKQMHQEMIRQMALLARSEPAMSMEARTRRIDEITKTIAGLDTRMSVLGTLVTGQPEAWQRTVDKLKSLREQAQGLQMNMAAQQARRRAIQDVLSKLQKDADQQRREDAISLELEKIVALREKELARRKSAPGTFSNADLAQSETDLAEVKIRLLERQAAIGKSGKGELMDRLTDELAMVSINATDLEIQVALIQDQISAMDPTRMTSDALGALIASDPTLDPDASKTMPPLFYDMDVERYKLRVEWFTLVVEDVTALPDEAEPAIGL